MSKLEPTRTYSNRTDLDPATLAASLRCMAGDGSVEWVMEPIQAAVLHDIADLLDEYEKLREDQEDLEGYDQTLRDRLRQQTELRVKAEDENARLRELAKGLYEFAYAEYPRAAKAGFADDLRELGIEVDDGTE